MGFDPVSAGFSFLASTAGSLLDDSLQKGRTEWNKEQNLDMYRKAPLAQVQGLNAAGLNPMLAYSKLDFGSAAPGPMSHTDIAGDYGTIAQASYQRDVAKSTVEKQAAETQKTLADAGLSENSLRVAENFTRAMANHDGVMRIMSMSNADEGIEKFLKRSRVDPELADAAATVQERLNAEELNKLLNMPATNFFMQAMQMLLKTLLHLRGSTVNRNSTINLAPTPSK